MSLTQLIGSVTAIWVAIWVGTTILLFYVYNKHMKQLDRRVEKLEER